MVEIGRKIGRKKKRDGEAAELGWVAEHLYLLCFRAGGMDPWQGLPVLSCFPTEQDISHFTFPQENVSSRGGKKK